MLRAATARDQRETATAAALHDIPDYDMAALRHIMVPLRHAMLPLRSMMCRSPAIVLSPAVTARAGPQGLSCPRPRGPGTAITRYRGEFPAH
jgi:transposase